MDWRHIPVVLVQVPVAREHSLLAGSSVELVGPPVPMHPVVPVVQIDHPTDQLLELVATTTDQNRHHCHMLLVLRVGYLVVPTEKRSAEVAPMHQARKQVLPTAAVLPNLLHLMHSRRQAVVVGQGFAHPRGKVAVEQAFAPSREFVAAVSG
jgi:hypothetical protein